MGTTEWTIIGTAIGLLVVLIPVIKFVNSASTNELKAIIADNRAESKGEIAEVRTEIAGVRTEIAVVRTEIAELRSEFTGDIAGLRAELKGDMADLRAELKGDMADLRAELKGDMADLRAELKGDMADLRSELKLDFQANRAEIITNRRMLGRFALHRHGDDGLPLAPLTDALEPLDGNDPQDNENGSD